MTNIRGPVRIQPGMTPAMAMPCPSVRSRRIWLRATCPKITVSGLVMPQEMKPANRKKRGSRGGRPVSHDPDLYRQRNTAERRINRIKEWRGRPSASTRHPRVTSPAFIYVEPSCGSEAFNPSEDPKSVRALARSFTIFV
ncbi:hypothetical protein GCM10010517_77870 [Streptosporangium fragile]|uniref:Transposase n=1 Tax=Streptosporangium fragile TaxID=46186 RepID=A0ABN3WDY5_9ACTN